MKTRNRGPRLFMVRKSLASAREAVSTPGKRRARYRELLAEVAMMPKERKWTRG